MGCVWSKQAGAPAAPATDAAGATPVAPTTGAATSVSRQDYLDRHSGVTNPTSSVPEPTPAPKPGAGQTAEEKNLLKVISVDFLIRSNARDHHTNMYELTQERDEEGGGGKAPVRLVVRRGEPFDIDIKFDRAFDTARDDIKLVFDVGSDPRESRGTRVVLNLSDEDLPRQWGAKLVSSKQETTTVRIFTPPDLQVAKWTFKFDTMVIKEEEASKVFRYTHDEPIYVLFNPWCPDDAVFMSDERSRNEYVQNATGGVYYGTAKQIASMPWNFGQFEDFILECCFYLLDQSTLSWRLRGNPIHVVRKISALANAPDDNGVLVGNWSGMYEGGTAPSSWCGSVAILEQYWKTKEPVKYGQCWVFSAVVTTICRCLGIPARSVTNFASAHDTDGSITLDSHWSHDGSLLEEYNSDSIWNFHVWNDVWMTRPDLPPGFGGWQAIDATPQETSDGIYCAGPASLEALKNGLVHLPYDGPFIFAEVNADKVNWIQKPDGGWTHTIESNCIGKNISTYGLHNRGRMDITDCYKFSEGSQQERTAVWRAANKCSTRKEIYKVDIEDMKFELTEKDDALLGEPFDVSMKISNNGELERKVNVTLTATVVNYTGVPIKMIKASHISVKIPPHKEDIATMKVKLAEYLDKLTADCHIKISCMSQVEETKQFHCQSDDFRLLKPTITVKVPATVQLGKEYEIEASFKNPLPWSLVNCEYRVEGAGLLRPITFKRGTVEPHGESKLRAKLSPRSLGAKEIIVGFDSKELSGLTGTASLVVTEASA